MYRGREAEEEGHDARADRISRRSRPQHLLERYSELERESETAGLYEEALEARRLRLEQEASVVYWRERLSAVA